jgi:hypothetical protein
MDNPFSVLPAKARSYIYLIAFVAALIVTAILAANGDWLQAVGSFLSSLVALLAKSNIQE